MSLLHCFGVGVQGKKYARSESVDQDVHFSASFLLQTKTLPFNPCEILMSHHIIGKNLRCKKSHLAAIGTSEAIFACDVIVTSYLKPIVGIIIRETLWV
jgi:hypothetical protein